MSCSQTLDALLHPFSFPNAQVDNARVVFTSTPAAAAAVDELKVSWLAAHEPFPSRASSSCRSTAYPAYPLQETASPSRVNANPAIPSLYPLDDQACRLTSEQELLCNPEPPFRSSLADITTRLDISGHHDASGSGTESASLTDSRGGRPVAPCLAPLVYQVSPSTQFRNEYFQVAHSSIAGWGAFATKPLLRGDTILRERPLLVADQSCLFREFDKLDPQAKHVALSLHANELVKPGTPLIQAVWATNCFTVGGRRAGLFPVAARFNHACHPAHNVHFSFDKQSGCLELFVRVDKIATGEELRISYGRDRTLAELYETYGFPCRCGACPGLSEVDVKRLTSHW